MKFTVLATETTKYGMEIEANSLEEARQMAQLSDVDSFTSYEYDFVVTDVEELK